MAQQDDGYTFELSEDVARTLVRCRNRFGVEIAADLYRRKDLDESGTHPALVIGPPHGGVKEQGPGVYAQEMAKRGFVAIGFDTSYNGESGGEPRHITSPEVFAEDFSAGVDFLGTLRYVDRTKVGAIGICGSGGFALSAAQVDTRIRAVATAAMYDISRVNRSGWQDALTDDERRKRLLDLADQRWRDVDEGQPALTPVFPSEIPAEGVDPITAEFFEYYDAERGHHPRSIGGFTITSAMAHSNAGAVAHLEDIAPRRILLITGDQAHSRYFSDTVHEQTEGWSDLVVVPGARHIDLYDRTAVFASLDFIYAPTRDVDAAVAHYVDTLGGELRWKVRAMDTTVAAVQVCDDGPLVLLAGHLRGDAPVLVYRVDNYAETTASLRAAGIHLDELEIPHGPCASFEAEGGQRLAVYELARPDALTHFDGRIDP